MEFECRGAGSVWVCKGMWDVIGDGMVDFWMFGVYMWISLIMKIILLDA